MKNDRIIANSKYYSLIMIWTFVCSVFNVWDDPVNYQEFFFGLAAAIAFVPPFIVLLKLSKQKLYSYVIFGGIWITVLSWCYQPLIDYIQYIDDLKIFNPIVIWLIITALITLLWKTKLLK